MPQLPKPFRRPSIDLSPHDKTWEHIPASQVKVGDIVADFGKVSAIDSGPFGVELENIEGVGYILDVDDSLFVFSNHG